MTPEEYIRELALAITRQEDQTDSEMKGALFLLALRIRALVLTLPEGGIARQMEYPRLLPRITSEVQATSNRIFAILRTRLEAVERLSLTAAGELFDAVPPQGRPVSVLLEQTRVGVQSLLTLFRYNERLGSSDFTAQLIRLLDKSLQAEFIKGTPTDEVADKVVEVRIRRGEEVPVVNKGSVANGWRFRTKAIVAAAYWQIAFNAQQRTAVEAVRVIEEWEWSAVLDPKTCPICRPLDGERSPYPAGFPQGPPPLHPNCVLGDTQITTGTLIAATRAMYSGNIVTIRTESGRKLSVTAQHPMLTLTGWVRACELSNGLDLLSHRSGAPTPIDLPDLNDAPATAEQIFEAFRSSSSVTTTCVPAAPMQFHGDGASAQGNVEIVWTDRILKETVNADYIQLLSKFQSVVTDSELALPSGLSTTDAFFLGMNAASSGLVCLVEQCLALLRGELGLTKQHRLAAIALSNPALSQPCYDNVPGATKYLRQVLDACPGFVTTDKIIDIKIEPAGHPLPVYDFTTLSGMYTAATQLTHNCRCVLIPIYGD